MPGAQYDCIGDRYLEVADLPTGLLQQASMRALVGDISGLTVLDLACGAGSYTQKVVTEWGALRAVGVDISPLTIKIARQRTQDDPRVEFHVADCARPFYMGRFDVVISRWLLNYAANDGEMVEMWRNIFHNLKPGGRVIGICPDLGAIEKGGNLPVGNYNGQSVEVIERLENGGVRVQTTLHTSNPFSLKNYFLPREVYNRGAKLAGMKDVQWVTHPGFEVPGLGWIWRRFESSLFLTISPLYGHWNRGGSVFCRSRMIRSEAGDLVNNYGNAGLQLCRQEITKQAPISYTCSLSLFKPPSRSA